MRILKRLLSGAMALVMLIATVSIPPSVHAAALHKWGKYNTINTPVYVPCPVCWGTGSANTHCYNCDRWFRSAGIIGSAGTTCYFCGSTNTNGGGSGCHDVQGCKATGQKHQSTTHTKGSFIQSITAASSTYPTDGYHSDGYWYVYEGLAIQPQSPLNIAPVAPPTYGDSFTLSAAGGSTGNPIVWSIVSGNATISGNRVTTTGIGNIVIKAVMPGNANYYDAEATTTVAVAQKALTVSGSLSAQNKVYDGDKMAQFTGDLALVGVINGDNVTLSSVSAQFTSADVGNNKAITVSPFTLSGTDAGNYTLTQPVLTGYKADITAKNLTVTDTAVNDKTYDGDTTATYITSPKLAGIVGSDDVTLSGGTPSFKTATKGVDKELTLVPFTLEGTKKGNYALTQPVLSTADITAFQVTVADVAAKDKTYDGTTDAEFAGTPKLVGVKTGDDVSLVNGVPSFDSKNVGTDKTISYTAFALSGTDAENYAIVQPGTTTADVTPKALTTKPITVQDKQYDATTAATIETELEGIVSGDTVALNAGKAEFDTADVGSDKAVTVSPFILSGTDAGNYTLTQPALTGYKANITAKNLTVTDTAVNDKTYDGSTTATYTTVPKPVGVVGSDDVTLSGGTPSFKTAGKGADKELTLVPFTLEGAKKGNYTLTQPVLGTADITALQVTVADVAAKDKTYDGTTDAEFAGAPKLVGIKPGDDVSLVNGKPSFDDKNVGVDKVISYVGFELRGSDAENYDLRVSTTKASIKRRPLTVSPLEFKDKVYDNTTAIQFVNDPVLVNLCKDDDVILSGGVPVMSSSEVGSAVSVSLTPFSIAGVDAENYQFTSPSLTGYTAKVTPKPITIIPDSKSKVFGQPDPQLTYTYAPSFYGDEFIVGDITRKLGESAGNYDFDIGDMDVSGGNYYLKLDSKSSFAVLKDNKDIMLSTARNKSNGKTEMVFHVTSDIIKDGNISFYILGNKVGEAPFTDGKASMAFSPISAGSYTVVAKLTDSRNYADVTSNAATFTITASDLGQGDILVPPYLPSNPPKVVEPVDTDGGTKKPNIVVEVEKDTSKPLPQTSKPVAPSIDTSSVNQITSSTVSAAEPPVVPNEDNHQFIIETLPQPSTTAEEKEQIEQDIQEAYDNGDSAELVVVDVSASSNMQKYNEKAQDKVVGIYNTKLMYAGVEIAPDKPLSVELPLPENGKAKAYDVYRLMEDGSLKKVEVKSASAGTVKFDTLEMGNYIICERSSSIVFNMITAVLLAVSLCMSAFILIILLKKKKKEDPQE